MNRKVIGKNQISAKVIAYSKYSNHKPMITMELEYPRIIHSEFMTHRMLSKNSASSRAIPVKTILEHVRNNPQMPVEWGLNQSGMQASGPADAAKTEGGKQVWLSAMRDMIAHSSVLSDIGFHKQICNRLIEPFFQMKVIVSGTEFNNFFHLRLHESADPTIKELAMVMYIALNEAEPTTLYDGDWHLPYIDIKANSRDFPIYSIEGQELTLGEAKIISASCCAQVSYRKNDNDLEKAKNIFSRLIESDPVHASPVEHQATPITYIEEPFDPRTWEPGITHVTKNGDLWSGNLRGWIQYRQLINNHVIW